MLFTKKRLHKIKKTKNQSRKKYKKIRGGRRRRRGRSFRRRKHFNLRTKTLKNYKKQRGGNNKNLFIIPMRNKSNGFSKLQLVEVDSTYRDFKTSAYHPTTGFNIQSKSAKANELLMEKHPTQIKTLHTFEIDTVTSNGDINDFVNILMLLIESFKANNIIENKEIINIIDLAIQESKNHEMCCSETSLALSGIPTSPSGAPTTDQGESG